MTRMIRFCLIIFLGAAAFAAMPAFAEEILCPDTDLSKRTAPGDIGGVQADIERLNLCVERAKLLKALDDVVKARQDILKKITEPDDMMPNGALTTGLGTAANGGIPPLPVGALPPLQGGNKGDKNAVPQDLKPGEVRITNAAGNSFEQAAAPVAPTWQIRKIWGQGAGMRAQIADPGTGTLLNVLKADPLPDGSVVESVSVKGVTISRNGNITDLSWEQTNASASNNAKVIP